MSENDLVLLTKDDGTTKKMQLWELVDLSEVEREEIREVSPGSFTVHCTNCHEESDVPWSDLQGVLSSHCGTCEVNDDGEGEMALGESPEKAIAAFKVFEEKLAKLLETRSGRPDYWEYVIHFTKYDAMVEILAKRKIEARPTGYFKVPAICMTDTPVVHSAEFRRRYGEYGLVFEKSAILEADGGPAVYLNDVTLADQMKVGFADALKPFVNLYRHDATAPEWAQAKFVDYLYDREWRVPTDLNLDKTKPIGIIFPKKKSIEDKLGQHWHELVRAAYEYGSVQDG